MPMTRSFRCKDDAGNTYIVEEWSIMRRGPQPTLDGARSEMQAGGVEFRIAGGGWANQTDDPDVFSLGDGKTLLRRATP